MANLETPNSAPSESPAQVTVTLLVGGEKRSVVVRRGLGLEAICARHRLPLEFDCRKADCGICIVRVLEHLDNLSDKTPAEADILKAMHAEPIERLACQARVFGNVTIEIEKFF
jgi:ferredoxin